MAQVCCTHLPHYLAHLPTCVMVQFNSHTCLHSMRHEVSCSRWGTALTHVTLCDVLPSDPYAAMWLLCCHVILMLSSDPYAAKWPICCPVTLMLPNDSYTAKWLVRCQMTLTLPNDSYTAKLLIHCQISPTLPNDSYPAKWFLPCQMTPTLSNDSYTAKWLLHCQMTPTLPNVPYPAVTPTLPSDPSSHCNSNFMSSLFKRRVYIISTIIMFTVMCIEILIYTPGDCPREAMRKY